jgi:lipoyl(octanoyl) transferase
MKTNHKQVIFKHLGSIDYQTAWDYQEKLFQEIIAQKVANRAKSPEEQQFAPNYLLFCEHPHVYTLGKSGKAENLLADAEKLQQIEAAFYPINRGGDITYHGFGQLVGYPILDLDHFFTDIHRYLRYLEEAIIQVLAHYGLSAGRIEGLTGVWLDHEARLNPRKICAMGIRSSRWVTMHGFALNVNTDLSYFEHIIPCGISDKAVTSMQKELGYRLDMKEVEGLLLQELSRIFEMEIVEA